MPTEQPLADITFRQARKADLTAIVALLADDVLGAGRERVGPTLDSAYTNAFQRIEADPSEILIVAIDGGDAVVGCLQVSILPGLSLAGATRGQIEGVRVANSRRGHGLGEALVAHAIGICRAHRCALVQLTTNAARTDAHRFYERLGFAPTHIGFKLPLT